MKSAKTSLIIFAVLTPAMMLSCLGPRKLTTDQTFLNLKPVEQLPVYDLESIPANFEVTIENVADMGSSYKNRAAFYINDYLIMPDEDITNIQNAYHYKLKLQPGFYNIKGEYFALDGFSERKFNIKPQTKVMVKPGFVTKVQCNIEKNWDGTPLNNPLLFQVSYLQLSRQNAEQPPSVKPQPPKRQRKQAPIPKARQLPPKKKLINKNMVVLQVNTSPTGADVIVDDKYIGQTPLRALIDRQSDHILQLSLKGYEDVIKYFNKTQFGKEKTIHFLQKLKAK